MGKNISMYRKLFPGLFLSFGFTVAVSTKLNRCDARAKAVPQKREVSVLFERRESHTSDKNAIVLLTDSDKRSMILVPKELEELNSSLYKTAYP